MGAFRFTLAGRRVASARVAFGGIAATPKRAAHAEAALAGVSLDDPTSWATAQAALAKDFTPLSDMRASSAYRAEVAANLLKKALIEVSGAKTPTRIGETLAAL
jgi:xanthine dehydrogenase small subunit